MSRMSISSHRMTMLIGMVAATGLGLGVACQAPADDPWQLQTTANALRPGSGSAKKCIHTVVAQWSGQTVQGFKNKNLHLEKLRVTLADHDHARVQYTDKAEESVTPVEKEARNEFIASCKAWFGEAWVGHWVPHIGSGGALAGIVMYDEEEQPWLVKHEKVQSAITSGTDEVTILLNNFVFEPFI